MQIFAISRDSTSLLNDPLVVDLIVGGTATLGVDYNLVGELDSFFNAQSGQVTIPAGEFNSTVRIVPIPDAIVEEDETVILTIVPTPNVSQLGAVYTATITLVNDDYPAIVDPLQSYKIVDINFDTGLAVDLKGNSIVTASSPAVVTTEKLSGTHSLLLNGLQYLDLTVPASNFGTEAYTISTAVRFNSLGYVNNINSPNLQYLFDCGSGNTSAISWYGQIDGFSVVNAGAAQISVSEVVNIDTWYTAALIKIDTKYLLVFNNQIIAAVNTAPASVDLSSSSIRIGRDKLGGTSGLLGYIDNFQIYNCAVGTNLSHQKTLKFKLSFANNNFNTDQGDIGTTVNTIPIFDFIVKNSLPASGFFDGSGYLTYPSNPNYDFAARGFEISGWFKAFITPNTVSCLISSGVSNSTFDSQSWGVYNNISVTSVSGKSAVNKLSFFVGGVTGNNALLASTTNINDGLPHYFRIIKYTGAVVVTVLIIDDKIEDVYIGGYNISATTRDLIIGNALNTPGRNFKGNLDDIAIFS
jgi:hypothetical protein